MSEMQDYNPASKIRTAVSSRPSPICRRWMPRASASRSSTSSARAGIPAVEHTEPENAFDHYWYMWKLPMFGETNVDAILAEAEACHKAHPNNHVRLIGYDNYAQSKGAEMVVFRGKPV